MTIRVHIEHLILDGFDLSPADRVLVQTAMQTELARLLTEGGVSPEIQHGGALRTVRAGELSAASREPALLGQQIAQSVYRGIGS